MPRLQVGLVEAFRRVARGDAPRRQHRAHYGGEVRQPFLVREGATQLPARSRPRWPRHAEFECWRKTSELLCPPNPNAFVITARSGAERAVLGT